MSGKTLGLIFCFAVFGASNAVSATIEEHCVVKQLIDHEVFGSGLFERIPGEEESRAHIGVFTSNGGDQIHVGDWYFPRKAKGDGVKTLVSKGKLVVAGRDSHFGKFLFVHNYARNEFRLFSLSGESRREVARGSCERR